MHQIIINGNMATDLESEAIVVQRNDGFCIQAVFTTSGSLGGVLKLQISNDKINWDDYPSSAVTLTEAGSWSWPVSVNNYAFVRLVYVAAGGDSGVLNANIN